MITVQLPARVEHLGGTEIDKLRDGIILCRTTSDRVYVKLAGFLLAFSKGAGGFSTILSIPSLPKEFYVAPAGTKITIEQQ